MNATRKEMQEIPEDFFHRKIVICTTSDGITLYSITTAIQTVANKRERAFHTIITLNGNELRLQPTNQVIVFTKHYNF